MITHCERLCVTAFKPQMIGSISVKIEESLGAIIGNNIFCKIKVKHNTKSFYYITCYKANLDIEFNAPIPVQSQQLSNVERE